MQRGLPRSSLPRAFPYVRHLCYYIWWCVWTFLLKQSQLLRCACLRPSLAVIDGREFYLYRVEDLVILICNNFDFWFRARISFFELRIGLFCILLSYAFAAKKSTVWCVVDRRCLVRIWWSQRHCVASLKLWRSVFLCFLLVCVCAPGLAFRNWTC